MTIQSFRTLLLVTGFALIVLSGSFQTKAQGLPVAAPNAVGMDAEKLNQIDGLVEQAIADKNMPGAVVLVGHKGKIVYRKAFGNRSLVPTVEKMTVDTIFDLASLTKPIATATSVMILVEQGKIRLSDTIGDFFPEIEDKDVKKVTVQQLLTHTSGFRPDFDLREKWTGREGMLDALKREKIRNPPGTKFVYSDIGFIVLGEIIERVSSESVNDYSSKWSKLLRQSDDNTFFRFDPIKESKNDPSIKRSLVLGGRFPKIAPTENVKGQQNYLGATFDGDETVGSEIIRGRVHDPTAFRMGGVAGHAGLFSTADDLARYCQMILNGGVLDGKRILSAQTVARMTAPNVISETGETRGLGWDMNTSFSSNRGELFPLGSFGHTGFTGTSVWIDRVSQTFVVFLSNRVHPDGKGNVTDIRAKVATVVASAIGDTPSEQFRQAESQYNAAVAAQLESWNYKRSADSLVRVSQFENQLAGKAPRVPLNATVLNGIDVLEKSNFKELDGLRIGLVTNQTGRNLNGKPTIDVLKEAKNVKLVALFSPEHGIRGELDQSKINDSVDEKTGLPIFSLYGETRRPKPEHLRDLDAIVFDIQDIGTRFYTYISTLKYVLDEAGKAGKTVIILDRPNPINGVDVEGPLADSDKLTFVAAHSIPVRHGMTVGELALMFNAEDKLGADVKIVKMQNWNREMWFDETGQTWINPSPNMRSLTEATLYPGIGLLETTNLSVGRGTDTPFEVVGAPWIDGRKLAAFLNSRKIAGVRFVAVNFPPVSSVFKSEKCGGVNLVITSRETFEPVRTGIEIASALRAIYETEWELKNFNRLLVNSQTIDNISIGKLPAEIENGWKKPLSEFARRRTEFLLYKK